MHLWEVKHSYYCTQMDSNGEYDLFDDFLEEWRDADFDYNLVFRWDWQDKDKYNEENNCVDDPEDDDYVDSDTLLIFWMHQRKGYISSSKVKVTKEDEPRVIEFLKPRMNHLFKLWEPLNTVE